MYQALMWGRSPGREGTYLTHPGRTRLGELPDANVGQRVEPPVSRCIGNDAR
jgi:hypothetical protein